RHPGFRRDDGRERWATVGPQKNARHPGEGWRAEVGCWVGSALLLRRRGLGRLHGEIDGAPELRGVGLVDVRLARAEGDDLVAAILECPGPELRALRCPGRLDRAPQLGLRILQHRAGGGGKVGPRQLALQAGGEQRLLP
ncbi:conserved hypothetical protein, partial [Ricinus communis]